METWAIVVAAGGGARFGGPKQFAPLGGSTVLDRAVATVREASCDGVVVVLPAGASWDPPPGVRTAIGGATRSASVRAGLVCVPETADVVVVHDAARPLVGDEVVGRVIGALAEGFDGAVPGLALHDTIKRVERDVVVETLVRDGLVAVQTPQAFVAAVLRACVESARDSTDCASLVEQGGGRVKVVAGDERLLKVTTKADLDLVASWL